MNTGIEERCKTCVELNLIMCHVCTLKLYVKEIEKQQIKKSGKIGGLLPCQYLEKVEQ